MKNSLSLPIALFITTTAMLVPLASAENLLPQGKFADATAGAPEGWTGHQQPHLDRITGLHEVVEEDGEVFLRLQKQKEESVLQLKTEAEVPEGTQAINLMLTSRVVEITPGHENPNRNVFRVGLNFEDADGNVLQEATPQIAKHSAADKWVDDTQRYDVPEGTAKVSLAFTMLNCMGTWEIKSLEVIAE